MEGLEYQRPPTPSLRLMRFSFEPNASLLEETGRFVQESQRRSTPFHFYASRQLLLTMPDYFEHQGSLVRIGRNFTARNEPLHIAPLLRSKPLNSSITRFQLKVTQQDLFDDMTSLEVKPTVVATSRAYDQQGLVRQLPNELAAQPLTGHYLFIDVASSALVQLHEQATLKRSFIDKAAHEKFFMHTIALSNIRDIHPSTDRSL